MTRRTASAGGGIDRGDSGAVSRRGLLLGGAAVVLAAAAGVPVAAALRPQTSLVRDMLGRKVFTVAHRGGSVDWPEESEFAYHSAAASSVDALEMSVARTSDGVWFGSHDATLDRLSGTKDFTIADHTWDEIQSHQIAPPKQHAHQPSRPYWRLEDLIRKYHKTHALWVDPKAADPRYYRELLGLMSRHIGSDSLADVFVAKSDARNVAWARLALGYGLQTWGFYFDRDLTADPKLFAQTQAPWTLLGLDWNASATHWSQFMADGRPVVAHIIVSKSQRAVALRRGARGLMIAGITEVLG